MSRLVGYLSAVVVLNGAGWAALLLLVGPHHPAMVGLGVLAFTFGLRHAFDADHISAIDNTTRKLLGEGLPADGAGFYFSLGHSTVVALMTAGIGLSARWVEGTMPALRQIGGTVGTGVSGVFLFLIAAVNFGVLLDVWRVWQGVRTGAVPQTELDRQQTLRGLMTRVLGRFVRLVRTDRHLYPIGLLFGLGFDTASEVALLAISAGAVSRRLPIAAVMVLPLLFAAGMALMDTLDGAFMTRAYGWAFTTPLRRAYYNLTVTGLSVLIALAVGGVECAQVVGSTFRLSAGFWTAVQGLNLQTLGYLIVGLFVVTWAGSYAWARWAGGR